MATRAIQNGNLLINLIHMHTKAPIHHHDHKPTHSLPHTWQIKQYTCTDSHYIVIYNPQSIHKFTQNPQPIHKSTNPRPHWSWLFTKHQSHIQVHPNKPNPYPSPTAKDNNPSPKPNPKPKHRFTTDHTIPNSPFKVEWEKKIEKWKTERKREESSREGERKVEREREARLGLAEPKTSINGGGGERRLRCMVPMREQWPWPWRSWSEPWDRVRLEGEWKERNEEEGKGGRLEKNEKERDGSGQPDPVLKVKPYPVQWWTGLPPPLTQ